MHDYQAQQAARAAVAAALQAANQHLVAVGDKFGKNDSLNAAAKNIRIELKAAFPGVKFSVKSSRFSMGNSISVNWIDGPTGDQVSAIIGRYAAGSFNGMEDIYEYSRDAWKDAFGDAKYVHASRELSDKAIASAIRTATARGRIAEGATVAAYRAGSLGYGYQSDAEVISHIAYRRTWCLTKAAKVQAEEVAA